ncbi:hypothetical protein IEN85_16365 [Pelagicoccus sp. NFK12]|uniref:Right handed beta helix domain-containing protein n=1 Tax=Pelagicoccus enzymogenes TaxID=2773457 RepID=A0A927FA14_9BACT|nr:hypothetical protein [Pelagicoccus enzymogenes]MBD5781074.1 hypothetical protein [Pelagicoccus enzymogenes]
MKLINHYIYHTFILTIASILFCGPTAYSAVIEKPTEDNTGPISDYETLKKNSVSGNYYLTTEGMIFEKYLMTGGNLIVTANNITIKDGLHENGSFFNILIHDGVTGTKIEHVEMIGASSEAIRGGDYTAKYLHIHDQIGDAIKPKNNVTIESSFFERLGSAKGAHADGIQIMEGFSNIQIRYNNFEMPPGLDGYANSQCIIIHPTVSNVTIDSNWINGGGHSVNINPDTTEIELTNNAFGFDFSFSPGGGATAYIACNTWQKAGTYGGVAYEAGDLLPGQSSSNDCQKGIHTPKSPSNLRNQMGEQPK